MILLQQTNHFAVQREHLLDERPAEVEQRHVERSQVVGHVASPLLNQVLRNQ